MTGAGGRLASRRGWSLAVLLLLCVRCASVHLAVEQPPAAPRGAGGGQFLAGAAEVDITPPPGLPVFGSSVEAEPSVRGYRMRLFARVLAFEDRRGERLAIVQADLGAVSGLLHREIARRAASAGLAPDRLLLAATHTHGAPGGYFSVGYYNRFGAALSGFDPDVLEWFASRMSAAVIQAFGDLAPARIGAAERPVAGLTRNRSADAWKHNFPPGQVPPGLENVDSTLRILRVDRVESGASRPIAALVVFAAHGTAASVRQKLYHGDLQAVAAEVLRRKVIQAHPSASSFVVAVVNGAEGDVSPNYQKQGFAEADRIGSLLASEAFEAFEGPAANGPGDSAGVDLFHAYREVALPDKGTSAGPLCGRAVVGVPVLGGADDGRSFLYGAFDVKEGTKRKSHGCQAQKLPALGWFQKILLKPADFPRVAPFQLFRFGDVVTLVTVPGEATTQTGRAIRAAVQEKQGRGIVAVVGLTDEYTSYWATPAEYAVQDYEGGSTLYGPHQAILASDQLADLAGSLAGGNTGFPARREFDPGPKKSFWGSRGPCRSDLWKPGAVRKDGSAAVFEWTGLSRRENCGPVPIVSIECGGQPLRDSDGIRVEDRGLDFQVSREGNADWQARWAIPPALVGRQACRFRVERPQMPPLLSQEFTP